MIKKHFIILFWFFLLTSCSLLKQPKAQPIHAPSYAIAYETTIQSYHNYIKRQYLVEDFMQGVQDWFAHRIVLPLEQIQHNLSQQFLPEKVFTYYTGVLYAANLEHKLQAIHASCWQQVDLSSLKQGIHEAMFDLQQNQPRLNDQTLIDNSEQFLWLCQPNLAQ